MRRRTRYRGALVVALLLVATFQARAATGEDEWVEVRSDHFVVFSDAGEGRARRIASLLETVREVFLRALPGVGAQAGPPLEVFAARNTTSLKRLLPEYAERDSRVLPVGVFLRTPDKNVIVLQENARTESPYEVVFHEYFHSLALPVIPWAPVWFQEGIAGFWEKTIIKKDSVETARPSQQYLELLRNERLMPLEDLVNADRAFTQSLPGHRTTIFYAQSWALVHYMLLGDRTRSLRDRVTPYLEYTRNGQAGVEAFEAAFGDIEEVERQLRQYLKRFQFQALRVEKPENIDDESHAAATLTAHQAHARLGSYFVHTGRYEEGRAELEQALVLSPDDALAHEAFGVLHYRTGAHEDAKVSFEKAASLNGAIHLPRFYLAILEIPSVVDQDGLMRVQAHLERAVQMNPYHAPSLSRLSLLYASTGEQTELALTLARRAVALHPDDPVAHAALGVTAKAVGRINEARSALETANRLAPSYELARNELEEVKRIQRNPVSGVWAFEGIQGWMRIGEDGAALRCRVSVSGAVERRSGTFADSAVTWTIPAGNGPPALVMDTVSLAGGKLRLQTEQGDFILRRIASLPEFCELGDWPG